jgi:hypothetical protein
MHYIVMTEIEIRSNLTKVAGGLGKISAFVDSNYPVTLAAILVATVLVIFAII